MLQIQYSPTQLNRLKDLFIQIQNNETGSTFQEAVTHFFNDVNRMEVLLLEHTLLTQENNITKEAMIKLSQWHPHLFLHKENETYEENHPISLFQKENAVFKKVLNEMRELLEILEKAPEKKTINRLQEIIYQLGAFHRHFHRKEKLYFPILEQYGQHAATRTSWRKDDYIRALYQGVKRQIDALPHIEFSHVMQTFIPFEQALTEMIFLEDALLLPVFHELFQPSEWQRIGDESIAFGYAMIEEPEVRWKEAMEQSTPDDAPLTEEGKGNIKFGGGFLTTEEANLILNHLPLEITFVDKNSVFKYFNTITEAADMMLIRTPTSIGRNVADCHPPKSLNKVMTLIRDLKTRKRTSETMWFKKGEAYIHITYKPLFNEVDEFIGILEYVQDIQPFLNLPTEVKRNLSK